MKLKSKAIKFITATLGATTLGVLGVTATANADEIYTVQSGDTLSSISYKYANDTSMIQNIANKNNISNIDFILVGQKLYISDSGQIKQATKQEIATNACC
jgi:LysM repeat protein